MKKYLYAVLGLAIVLIGAVFLGPLFIDVNRFKPAIQSQFKAATGYDLDMKGEISVSFFPVVKATVKDVSVFSGQNNLVNIEQVTAYPKLFPLLGGTLRVNSIMVEKPAAMLEKTEDGKNWDDKSGTSAPQAKADDKLDMHITSLEIAGGKVDYADKVKKKTYSLSEINFKTDIAAVTGPVEFDGSLKYNDLKLGLKGKIANFAEPKLAVTTSILGSEISFDGDIKDDTAVGKFALKSKDIEALAKFLQADEIKHLSKLPIDISGDVNYSPTKIDFKNLKIAVGATKGAGDLNFALDGSITAGADLKFETINLDEILPKGAATAPDVKKTDEEKKEESDNPQKDISAELNIAADTVIYGGVAYKDLVVKSTSDHGEVSVQPFSFKFPKSGSAEIFGILSRDTEGRFFEGHVTADSDNFADILKSFKVNLDGIKDGKLKNFKLDSELVVNIRDKLSAELSETILTVDNSLFKGNVSLDLDKLMGIDVNGAVDAIDMDKYIVPGGPVLASRSKLQVTGPTDDKPFRIEWLEELPFKGAANILVGKFTYGGDDYNNLRLRGNFQPETLNIDELIASGKRLQIAAKGSLYAYAGKKPKIDIEANIGKVNLADFVKPEEVTQPRPDDKSRWSKQPFDFSFLRKIDMDFKANILAFIHDKIVLTNISTEGYIEKSKLTVKKVSADMFGGKVELNGNIEASAVPSLGLAYSGDGVDINKFFDAFADDKRVTGKFNFSGSLASSGIYQQAMISNLKGSISVIGANIVVKGFDLDGMAEQITNTNNIADISSIARTVSGDEAVTYLKSVSGVIVAEDGVARNQGQGIDMQTASGEGFYSGKGDILNWNLETNAVFKINMGKNKPQPAVSIHIFGPLDEPKKDINLDEIRRYISGRGAQLLLNTGTVGPANPAAPPPDAKPADNAAPPQADQQPAAPVKYTNRAEALKAKKAAQKEALKEKRQQQILQLEQNQIQQQQNQATPQPAGPTSITIPTE